MEEGEGDGSDDEQQNAEMEELERQYQHLQHEEQYGFVLNDTIFGLLLKKLGS